MVVCSAGREAVPLMAMVDRFVEVEVDDNVELALRVVCCWRVGRVVCRVGSRVGELISGSNASLFCARGIGVGVSGTG